MNTHTDITEFTGLDILKIDIANTYGLDKETYSTRLEWVDTKLEWFKQHKLEEHLPLYALHTIAAEPLLFKKAVIAYDQAMSTGTTNHNVFMDATASGLQIMSALSNCKATGIATNLVNNGVRNDPYTLVTDRMLELLPNSDMFEGLSKSEVRAIVKKPIMTYFYNSTANPISIFGEDTPEYEAFLQALNELFPGAIAVMNIINSKWNSQATYHSWTLPDGHVSHVKVINKVVTTIQVDELECQNTFKYSCNFNQPSTKSTSLAPNIIHSIDAYIVREVVRRCDFQVAHIHDAFTCHPNNMPTLMDQYRIILSEIANSNLLADILSDITGSSVQLEKYNYDLSSEILKSQYALC